MSREMNAMNSRSLTHKISVCAAAIGLLFLSGAMSQAYGQRDPFAKPGYAKPRPAPRQGSGQPSSKGGGQGTSAATPKAPVNYGPPAVEARIEYFKRLREQAAMSGQPLPKVTSVMTLSELNVTGIFKTPRGYAAIVEATPIKLSYTIYPGEKFFDGQLVAVEENKLTFRKVTKTGPGKFVASVETKPLQQYSTRAQIEGTAPPVQVANAAQSPMLSPVDEMASDEPVNDAKQSKPKKSAKKPR